MATSLGSMAESKLGKLLDPIADKILLCSAIISIIIVSNDAFIGLMGMIILLRNFGYQVREYTPLIVSNLPRMLFLAKIKTSLQFMHCVPIIYHMVIS